MTEGAQAAPPPVAVPALGSLRLDDGSVPATAASGPLSWRASAALAAVTLRDQPALIAVALLGFLARGGLIVFLLPILVLPTPAGIGTFIGGTALTGAGASDSLIRLVAVIAIGALLTLIIGVLLGTVADVLLMRAAAAARLAGRVGDPAAESHADAEADIAVVAGAAAQAGAADTAEEATRRVPLNAAIVGRLSLVRLVAMTPLAVVGAWGAARLGMAIYDQLILPENLDVPLALRALREAAGPVAVVVVAWLVSEWLGGIATRWLLLRGGWTLAAFPRSWRLFARSPVSGTLTFLLPTVLLIALAAPVLALSATLWGLLQSLLADDVTLLLTLPATMVFVAVWGGGLLTVGLVTGWRSLLGDLDTVRGLERAGTDQDHD